MKLNELVSPASVACRADIASKKRALEQLADLLAEDAGEEQALDIFHHLTDREKLGSTSLGHGVALPHARSSNCDHARGAFIKLEQGIDFDSPDGQRTDLMFALLVPEHYTNEHLQILAELAGMFNDDKICETLRESHDDNELYNNLTGWHIESAAS